VGPLMRILRAAVYLPRSAQTLGPGHARHDLRNARTCRQTATANGQPLCYGFRRPSYLLMAGRRSTLRNRTVNTGVARTLFVPAFCDLSALWCISVSDLIMSLSEEAIAQHAANVAKLTQQMDELRALRRALCLNVAMRSSPKGARRSASRPLMRDSRARQGVFPPAI
jgi:hypothetical protein